MTPLGLSQTRLGRNLGVSPRRINEIVHGKRSITADTALRLSRFFGMSAEFWLGLQADFDLDTASDRLAERILREVGSEQSLDMTTGRPPKAQVSKKRTVHTYAELWHGSRVLLERAQAEPKGSKWLWMGSLFLTAFSFEAYLNHIGPKVFECWESL